ncbi:MAG TPA: helix-turn-helix transcriptional regulator, partial [Deltaproteobacteria bacterium]|nr:helix-turn-helix transcriptional regulator [Deltaproteobacteria bacterium]
MTRKKGNTFGERVRSLRVDRGISLEELSRQTGYPADFIARVEEGGVAPPVALVLQLGRAFKVDIEQLEDRRSREATKRRSQSHKKRVASYAYTALTRGGTENHLRAYLVTLD